MRKLKNLRKSLKQLGPSVIAFSGGCDSTFLLKVAADTLGKDNVLAVIGDSETYPAGEKKYALASVKSFGVPHLIIKTEELKNKKFSANTPARCFYCKDELFGRISELARKKNMRLLDGTNLSDLSDYRPGRAASKKWGVLSPLAEAGMTKDDIRRYSKMLNLATCGKPAQACLASRFSYGEKINQKKLSMVGKAESYLKNFGFHNLRVRYQPNSTAKIEVDVGDLPKVVSAGNRKKIISFLKKLGFIYVTLDIEGYRVGSQNLTFRRKT